MDSWKRLPLPSEGATPPLLFKYQTSASGYEILVTDLVYIWSENLTRKKILDNASKHDTSIDPSEDDEQYLVLLQKITDALQGSRGTTVSLIRSTGEDKLKLLTSTNLPSPLNPLEWIFTLSQLPQISLTEHILLPILKSELSQQARIQSLIEHIKQKDWALGKLFDKIESAGVDLSTVFPAMGGVRVSQKGPLLAQAAKHIKGVAPFDEESWNGSFAAKNLDYSLGIDIARELSGSSSLPASSDEDFAIPEDNWWSQLSSTVEKPKAAKPTKPREKVARKKTPSPMEEDTQSEDDEFQTMATPPRLRSPSRRERTTDRNLASPKPQEKGIQERKSPVESSPEATASEDDIRPASKPKTKAKGLGTIGGKQQKQPARKSHQPSESDSDSETSPEPKPKPKPKPSGHGTIGGKKPAPKKPKEKPRQKQENPDESTATNDSDVPKQKHKPTTRKPAPVQSPDDIPTESDNDTETSLSRPTKRKRPEPEPEPEPKPKRSGLLGQIGGGKKKKPQPPEPAPEEPSDGEKTTEDETAPPPPPAPEPSTTTKPKPKQKRPLGVIGGGAKSASASASPSPRKQPQPSPTPSASNENDTAPARKREQSSTPMRMPSRPSSKQEETKEKEEEVEETPEERANRKRQELRRQLEERGRGGAGAGGAGPAKKKRRF
ncbi:hypothetical protein FQN53_004398 [Emmonsiellopsis sp. PD_33]|nr:hypothetical protein FQN53_004398 [Emmonsiellopsis sp. PD_33]